MTTAAEESKPINLKVGTAWPVVHIVERPDKGWKVYLRWFDRTNGNHRQVATALVLRTKDGRRVKARIPQARAEAEILRERILAGEFDKPVVVKKEGGPLTLKQGLDAAIDAKRGKYKVDTPDRRELIRSMTLACDELGEDRTWEELLPSDLSAVCARKIRDLHMQGKNGHRAAVIVLRDMLRVASWLRQDGRMPANACYFDGMALKAQLDKDWLGITGSDRSHEPSRPRHTLDEMRAILAAAARVDPRLYLALAIGAELRLGQVRRVRRTDVTLGATTDAPHGMVRVVGQGKKGGETVYLTAGQRRVLNDALDCGYLRFLEDVFRAGALADYPLFPSERLKGTARKNPSPTAPKKSTIPTPWAGYATVAKHADVEPIGDDALRGLFRKAEAVAGVPHVQGRLGYGVRRVAVDVAKASGISREGLQAHGAWATSQVPDAIYSEQERGYARAEAARVRAQIRGEEE
jgi:integrase